MICLVLCINVTNLDISILLTLLCICFTKTCDMRPMCTLTLNLVVFPYCNINASSIRYDTHVEYSRLFQCECYILVSEQVVSDRALGH